MKINVDLTKNRLFSTNNNSNNVDQNDKTIDQ